MCVYLCYIVVTELYPTVRLHRTRRVTSSGVVRHPGALEQSEWFLKLSDVDSL